MLEKTRDPLKPIFFAIAKPFSILNPNTITVIGFLLSFIPVYFYLKKMILLAGISYIVLSFDFIDGAVARLKNKVTVFGEIFDSSLDRVTDAMLLFGMISGNFISWQLGFLSLIGFFMVSFTRARVEAASNKKFKMDVGFAQRGERLIFLSLGSILFFENIKVPLINLTLNSLEIVVAILCLLSWETFIYRLIYSKKMLEKFKDKF